MSAPSFQVGPETTVTVAYRVFDADGECVGQSDADEPLTFVFGRGQLLAPLERALDGLSAGRTTAVTLAPEDAYGRRDPKAVIEVDRSEVPEDVALGDSLEFENDQGGIVVLKVLELDDERAVLDMNHPLAGQRVRYELDVLAVRPATAEELAKADAALGGPAFSGPPDLVPLDRLRKGPSRGYESRRSPGPVDESTGASNLNGDKDG